VTSRGLRDAAAREGRISCAIIGGDVPKKIPWEEDKGGLRDNAEISSDIKREGGLGVKLPVNRQKGRRRP